MALQLLAATAAIATASPAPPASDCPTTLYLGSTDKVHYIVAFGAKTASTVSFQITLYSQHAVYNVSLPSVPIETPVTSPNATFRSTALALLNPGHEPLVGAAISSESRDRCPSDDFMIESAESLNNRRRYDRDPDQGALVDQLVHETGDGGNEVVPALSQTPPPDCASPFLPARLVQAMQPLYPLDAGFATGLVGIAVTLDDSGAVTDTRVWKSSGNAALDAAARDAADGSTYAPLVFACRPRGGTYVFDALFSH
jgi:TonB family protein